MIHTNYILIRICGERMTIIITALVNVIVILLLLQLCEPCGLKQNKKEDAREFDFTLVATLISALTATGSFILVYQENNLFSKHQFKMQDVYEEVVSKLASDDESERLVGAILIRLAS